jgi:hypothetical protein
MLVALAGVLYELRDLGGIGLMRPIWLSAATGVVGAILLQLLAPIVVHGVLTLLIVAAVAGASMLLLNMWGDYGSVLTLLKSLREQLGTSGRLAVVPSEQSIISRRPTTDD